MKEMEEYAKEVEAEKDYMIELHYKTAHFDE